MTGCGTRGRRSRAGARHSTGYGAAHGRFNVGDLRRAVGALLLAAALVLASIGGARAAGPARLVMLGDSITAGYGLPREMGLPSRLAAALHREDRPVTVIDAGVSGDTSAGGLARLDWLLADHPTHAVVALGGNDGLRGLGPEQTFANLDAIVGRLHAAGVAVLFCGMLAPPNLGRDYGAEFAAIYPRVAEKHAVPLYPFLLDGVAGDPRLNQPDGIHPNQQGVAVMVGRLMPYIDNLLDSPPQAQQAK